MAATASPTITATGPAAQLTTISNATPLVLTGTASDDTWTIRKSSSGNSIDVWFNTPTTNPPTQIVPIANIESITINGLAGDDLLIVDSTNGTLDGINRITFDGGANIDTLRFVGGDAIDVSSNAIAIGNLPILQTGVENLRIETLDGDDTISVHQPPVAAVSFDGGVGSDTLAFRGAATHLIAGDLGTIAPDFDVVVVHDLAVLNFSGSQHLGTLKLDGARASTS